MEESLMVRPGKEERKKLILSAAVFLAGYLLVLLFVFLAALVDPRFNGDWQGFFTSHFQEEFSFLINSFVLFVIIYLYFFFEGREFLYKLSNIVLVFSLLILSTLICYLWGHFVSQYFFTRPYAVFAILCLFLMGRRHALFLNAVFVLFMFSIDLFLRDSSTLIYSTLLIGFADGTIAVFLSNKMRTRGSLLLMGIYLAIPTVPIAFAFQIPIKGFGWIDYLSAAGFQILGCLSSAVLGLALMPPFEWMFNRLTAFRLRELTSTDAALLVRLKKEAPGTFNHSLIVAQLAESCAVAIGENAELARTAAYYHDVGKLKQPDCFTENQTDYNLHDEITPELSADIIRSHTKDGYELLIANHLPKAIANVALEHHGTLPIKYFYDKAVRYSGEADIKDFSYLGPVPHTKITAIIMISDAVEAATRAMPDRTPEKVEKTCRAIIEERMDLGQFDECDITLQELTVIKQTLVEALSGVHHHRVEYPAIQFNRNREAVRTEERHD